MDNILDFNVTSFDARFSDDGTTAEQEALFNGYPNNVTIYPPIMGIKTILLDRITIRLDRYIYKEDVAASANPFFFELWPSIQYFPPIKLSFNFSGVNIIPTSTKQYIGNLQTDLLSLNRVNENYNFRMTPNDLIASSTDLSDFYVNTDSFFYEYSPSSPISMKYNPNTELTNITLKITTPAAAKSYIPFSFDKANNASIIQYEKDYVTGVIANFTETNASPVVGVVPTKSLDQYGCQITAGPKYSYKRAVNVFYINSVFKYEM